jgi:CBS domain-containing protein
MVNMTKNRLIIYTKCNMISIYKYIGGNMATVESMLDDKGKVIFSLSPEKTIHDALKLMADKDVGAVLIMEGEKLLGIFTERDYARKGNLKGNSETTALQDVMTRQVYFVSPDQSAEACMAQMIDKHFRHLPVVKDGKVVGVISIIDVIKTVVSDKEALIAGMENFRMGMELMS